jgi:hypothetical protein
MTSGERADGRPGLGRVRHRMCTGADERGQPPAAASRWCAEDSAKWVQDDPLKSGGSTPEALTGQLRR